MQNIVDFKEDNFSITILTQPFLANSDSAMAEQTASQAQGIFKLYLAFLNAARDWAMDFIDFTGFQVMAGGRLRFGWKLERQSFPEADTFLPIFKQNKFLHSLSKSNYRLLQNNRAYATALQPGSACLYRSDDLASNILHAYSTAGFKANANLRIKINTKEPLQKRIIQNTLFHSLDSEEILFIKVAANCMSLSDTFSVLCKGQKSTINDAAALVAGFSLYLKQSVFRRTILVVDGPGEKGDEQILRFLLDSGDITGLTVIMFTDAMPIDCDLELNEDPENRLQRYISVPRAGHEDAALSGKEVELLKMFAFIGVPLPIAVAGSLAGPGSSALIKSLLERQYLREEQQRLSLGAAGHFDDGPDQAPASLLDSLAARTGWPYLVIRNHIARNDLTGLERYLGAHAGQGSDKIAPGPAADLLVSHLPHLAKNQELIAHFLEILIKTNSLDRAETIIAEHADPSRAQTRLQSAHLALQKKDYPRLQRLLAGFARVPENYRDKCLYLKFIVHEKNCEPDQADAFAKRIQDPYYRSLAAIQLSDRKIYRGDYAAAGTMLNAALEYFQARCCCREEIEIRNQMAKLHREKGSFSDAESLYKSMFIKSEGEGFRLHSAFTAVDLGNLYQENDDDFQAEGWYRKALTLFEKEKNRDGIMLVQANLIDIFIGAGNWNEAENLLRLSLAHNEEKKLPVSCAIDCLNWAQLEYVRLNYDQALSLLERAVCLFGKSVNKKGLAECALLRGKIFFAEAKVPDPLWPGVESIEGDQKIVWGLCQFREPAMTNSHAVALKKKLVAIKSRKNRFSALVMLLRKFKQTEWLDMLKDISRELSEKSKNYYFFEYWYVYFELVADKEHDAFLPKDIFFSTHDFFSMNKRRIPNKFAQMRIFFSEKDSCGSLFADARLVENHRQWRLPEDFFNSFLYEINKALKVDWLAVRLYEKERLLFDFASSPLFKELGEEMLQATRRQPEKQNLRLAEIKAKFSSYEKFFYPFANTKMMPWPMPGDFHADLVVAFKDDEAYFQNFFERNKDVLHKFAILFQNFFVNEFQIQKKLDFIIGSSDRIREMKRLIVKVSRVDFSLLISGESGSGKELVAHAVHLLSSRAGRPFISVNAAALPETLLEAELFGFKKGAFSGAVENRVGLLEAADGGTFFLDEIADLPFNLQAKILRVLQEKEIRRLGENKTVKVDIRLISASNKNLLEMIKTGSFREDLFYRLQDLTIHIPPLRERREDIPLLVDHFLKKHGRPADDPQKLLDIAALFRQDCFPGNVRELESNIKKLITFDPGLEHVAPVENMQSGLRSARQAFERSLLLNTLHETGWNKNKTANKLAISRMALFNMLKKHHITS